MNPTFLFLDHPSFYRFAISEGENEGLGAGVLRLGRQCKSRHRRDRQKRDEGGTMEELGDHDLSSNKEFSVLHPKQYGATVYGSQVDNVQKTIGSGIDSLDSPQTLPTIDNHYSPAGKGPFGADDPTIHSTESALSSSNPAVLSM